LITGKVSVRTFIFPGASTYWAHERCPSCTPLSEAQPPTRILLIDLTAKTSRHYCTAATISRFSFIFSSRYSPCRPADYKCLQQTRFIFPRWHSRFYRNVYEMSLTSFALAVVCKGLGLEKHLQKPAWNKYFVIWTEKRMTLEKIRLKMFHARSQVLGFVSYTTFSGNKIFVFVNCFK